MRSFVANACSTALAKSIGARSLPADLPEERDEPARAGERDAPLVEAERAAPLLAGAADVRAEPDSSDSPDSPGLSLVRDSRLPAFAAFAFGLRVGATSLLSLFDVSTTPSAGFARRLDFALRALASSSAVVSVFVRSRVVVGMSLSFRFVRDGAT